MIVDMVDSVAATGLTRSEPTWGLGTGLETGEGSTETGAGGLGGAG